MQGYTTDPLSRPWKIALHFYSFQDGLLTIYRDQKPIKSMKKNKTLISLILAFMKFSGFQLFLTFLFCGVAFASPTDSNGQSVLEEVVAMDVQDKKIKDVLFSIEKSVKIKFTYNPQSIAVNKKVSIYSRDKKLSDILSSIFSPMNVTFEVVGDYIVLKKAITVSDISPAGSTVPVALTVSGTVSDEFGNPLPGVNVLVKQTTNGTTTDADGKYSISVAAGTETLVFSFIGYELQEVAIDNRSSIDVSMLPDIASLEEVVVIGYGTAEKKEITSSVASIDAKDFNKGNVYDAAQFLQGKVAGLSIVKPGADPNAGYNIRLRGLSTFGANSSPLIIIDGVLGGSLQTLDPNEIESMDVLKDGSAAAIYGTRGSSGVIIITTKRGKRDLSGIEYNSFVSFEQLAKTVEIAGPERFVKEGGPDLGSKTDWVDAVTRTGLSQTHNFAFYGSSGQSNYRLSMNYREVEGIAIGSGFDQLNTRLNLNHSALEGRLNLSSTLGVTIRNATFVPYEVMRFALISNPTAPIYLNGDPAQGYLEPNTTEFHNPVAIMNETTDDGKYKTFLTTLKADYEIFDGLTASGFYSMQYESDVRSQYFSSKMRFAGSAGLKGRATKFTEDRTTQLFELTGSYKKSFDKLNFNVVAGYSYQKFLVENFSAFNTGFITDDLSYNNLGLGLGLNSDNASLRGFGSGKSESLLASFFGRAMFNYDDTYFFTAAYRREGSSRFGGNNRWGNFYSLSGGVDISKFFDSPFSMLKLRAGYGLTGNLPVPFYSYLSRLNGTGVTTFNDGSTDRLIRLFNYVSNENPDLKWEQKAELDFGIDFAGFNSRLFGSIDYYIRNSRDILFNQPVSQPPNFFGFTLLNLGELESKGLEIVANYNVINKNEFSWTTGLTFARNRTKIIELNEDSQVFFGGNLGPPGLNGTLPIKAQVGKELGLIIAPKYLGLNEDGTPNIKPLGDENGDGVNGELFVDWPVVGNALPDFELSWNNNLSYKKFDMSFTMRGAFGHSLVNVNRAYYEVPQNSSNYNLVVTKYYRPNLAGSEQFYDYFVEDATYVKLDNLSVGYNLRFKNSPVKNLRVYASGQNLFVITDYTGVDPEVHYGVDPLYPGVEDRNSYFRSKTYTIGVNIGL
jgi:TonB-dependent starch-binding outer membrane protein SusC